VNIANQQTSRSRGVTAFGFDGYQQIYSQYNSSFTFVSSLISYDTPVKFSIQQAVDSCWSSGNIFRVDTNNGLVIKSDYEGNELNSLSLSYPYSISVIQYQVPMEDENPTNNECLGCWVVDGTSVYKTDKDLNIDIEIINLSSPTIACTNHDSGGCYVVDEILGLLSFNSDGDMIATGSFTDSNVLGALSNSKGDLFILTENKLFKFADINGNLVKTIDYNITSYFSGKSVSCFDIDTSTDYLYVGGGTQSSLRIVKFDSSGTYLGVLSTSDSFPYILRASQHPSSDTFYVISDENKYFFVESSSSTSSEMFSDPSSTSSPSSAGFSESSSSDSGGFSESSSSENYSNSSSSQSDSESSSSSFGCEIIQTLEPPNPGGGNVDDISMTDDYMAIGNPTYDTSGNNNRGCVYLYEYAGGSWSYDTQINGSGDGDLFGGIVALDDSQSGQKDLACSSQLSLSTTGLVYVYRNTGASWSSTALFAGENVGDYFGSAIKLHNGRLVVGAPVYSSFLGAIYIYHYSSGWNFIQKITPSLGSTTATPSYGNRDGVDVFGNWIVVGDKSYDSNNGVVYIYRWNGSSWSEFQTLPSLTTQFGLTVAIYDNTLIVNGGLVYEFNGTSWVYQGSFGTNTGNISRLYKDSHVVGVSFPIYVNTKIDENWENIQILFVPTFSFWQGVDLNNSQVAASDGTFVYIYNCDNEFWSESSDSFSESSSSEMYSENSSSSSSSESSDSSSSLSSGGYSESSSSSSAPYEVLAQDAKYASMEIINSRPAIAYYDNNSGEMRFLMASDTSGDEWDNPATIGTFGIEDETYPPSLAEVNFKPAVLYCKGDSFPYVTQYIQSDDAFGTSWTDTPADILSGGGALYEYPLKLTYGSKPIAVYSQGGFSMYSLQADNADGSSWGAESPLLVTSEVTQYMDAIGSTRMVYFNPNKDEIGTVTGGTAGFWNPYSTVYSFPSTGYNNSVSVAIIGASYGVAFGYHPSIGNNILKFSIGSLSWNTYDASDEGSLVDIEQVSVYSINGRPAIAYIITGGILKYIRADNTGGTSWTDTPQIIDTNASYLTLRETNGRPAIAYQSEGSLKYIRAHDSNGDVWR